MNFKQLSSLLFSRFKKITFRQQYLTYSRYKKVLLLTSLCLIIGQLQAQITFTQKVDIPAIDVYAVAATNSNTLFAGTYPNGLYKSTDAGITWVGLDTALTGIFVEKIYPLDANTLFIIGFGQVRKSTDSGTSWTSLNLSVSNPSPKDIASFNANTLFITDGNHRVLKSTDGGTSWETFANATAFLRPGEIEVIDTNTIFVGTGFDGVYKTVDGGANWTQMNAGLDTLSLGIRSMVAVDANILFISTSDNSSNNSGFFKSLDGGANWTRLNTGLTALQNPMIYAIDANTIFASTFNGGITKSIDGGLTWTPINTGLTNTAVESAYPIDANNIFVGTRGGLFCGMPPCSVSDISVSPITCSDTVTFEVNFTPLASRNGEIEILEDGVVVGSDTTSPIAITSTGITPSNKTLLIQYKDEPKCPVPFEVFCEMPPCSVTGVSTSIPICSDSIIFEVSFTSLANRSGTIQVIENGVILASGTTSPLTVIYPDNTTSGKTFSIQYVDVPSCPVTFQVFGCNNCNPDDIVITKQSQIDSFQILYGACDYVVGSLTIGDDQDGIDNITNLGGLFNVIQIGGSFICLNNPFLGTGTTGFRSFNTSFNLNAVGGEIIISGNPNLTGLDLIENVATIGGSVTITNNDALTTIGLGNVETIGGAVNISENDALTTIGLDDVETIGGSVTVSDNSQLTNIDLFDNVETISGSVTIADNSALTDFGNLTNVMIDGTTNVNDNAGVLPTPSIADPCSCSDAKNIKSGKKITHFHDVLTISGTANASVVLLTGGANFLNGSLTQIANGTTLGNIPADGSNFTFDFFHPSDASGNISVSVGGTNLSPFPISVCSASTCTIPIPTMNEWGLLIFGLLVLNLSLFFVYRQDRIAKN